MKNPFEGFIKKIQPKRSNPTENTFHQAEENPYSLLKPREDLQRAYDLLGTLFNNYYRRGLEDREQLRAAIESCSDEELENFYEAIEVKMDRGLFRPENPGTKQEEFDQEQKKWVTFCDLVDSLVREVYNNRKK